MLLQLRDGFFHKKRILKKSRLFSVLTEKNAEKLLFMVSSAKMFLR